MKFSAFLSYSHGDKKAARWIASRLENYRIPKKVDVTDPKVLRTGRSRRLRKVFRDDIELSADVQLGSVIEEALSESNGLVVLCSKKSALSQWVDKEIRTYRDIHGPNNIIPIILEGEPNAEARGFSADQECFPPALRSVDLEPFGPSFKTKRERKAAILKIVSRLCGIDFDTLFDRDKRRRSARRNRRIAYVSVPMVLMGASVVVGWDYLRTKETLSISRDASALVHEFSPVEQTRLDGRAQVFRVFESRRRVDGYVCETSFGLRVSCEGEDFAEVRYEYDGAEVSRVKQYDRYGHLIRNIRIAERGTLGISDRGSQAEIASCETGVSPWSDVLSARTNVARFRYEIDESNQRVLATHFLNGYGFPTRDANGVYGKSYEYDGLGRILRVTNLGKDGLPQEDSNGLLSEQRNYSDGFFTVEFFGANGTPVSGLEGFHRLELELDTFGRTISQTQFDASGARKGSECNSHISKIVWNYDRFGRRVGESYFDHQDQPALHGAIQVASYRFDYEEPKRDGFVERKTAMNSDGQPNGPDMLFGISPTESEQRVDVEILQFSENGSYMHARTYESLSGSPLPRGDQAPFDYHRNELQTEFVEGGTKQTWSYFDVDGSLMNGPRGHPVVIENRNLNGQQTAKRFLDAAGQAVDGEEGFAEVRSEYDPSGALLISRKYFDHQGFPVANFVGIHETRFDYDQLGNQTYEAYFDERGEPAADSENGDRHRMEWSFNDFGQPTLDSGYLLDGSLAGGYLQRWEYDREGRLLRRWLEDDVGAAYPGECGSPKSLGNVLDSSRKLAVDVLSPEEILYDLQNRTMNVVYPGCSGESWSYYPNGSLRSHHIEAPEGAALVLGYGGFEIEKDSGGQVSAIHLFDLNGKPHQVRGYPGTISFRYEGDQISEIVLDATGQVRVLMADMGQVDLDPALLDIAKNVIRILYSADGQVVEEAVFTGAGIPSALYDSVGAGFPIGHHIRKIEWSGSSIASEQFLDSQQNTIHASNWLDSYALQRQPSRSGISLEVTDERSLSTPSALNSEVMSREWCGLKGWLEGQEQLDPALAARAMISKGFGDQCDTRRFLAVRLNNEDSPGRSYQGLTDLRVGDEIRVIMLLRNGNDACSPTSKLEDIFVGLHRIWSFQEGGTTTVAIQGTLALDDEVIRHTIQITGEFNVMEPAGVHLFADNDPIPKLRKYCQNGEVDDYEYELIEWGTFTEGLTDGHPNDVFERSLIRNLAPSPWGTSALVFDYRLQ